MVAIALDRAGTFVCAADRGTPVSRRSLRWLSQILWTDRGGDFNQRNFCFAALYRNDSLLAVDVWYHEPGAHRTLALIALRRDRTGNRRALWLQRSRGHPSALCLSFRRRNRWNIAPPEMAIANEDGSGTKNHRSRPPR